MEVHATVLESEYDCILLSVKNAIADAYAYAKYGSLEDVRKIFDRMEQRDVVSWTTLVTAYSQGSQWKTAIAIFSQMREEGCAVNQYTLASTLVACASLCYLEYGRPLHGLLYKTGLQNEGCTESALLHGTMKDATSRVKERCQKQAKMDLAIFFSLLITEFAQ
ncbi:hypothetical protein K7X08_033303 [Anisodus acutangulus]|uniref:Pentatricopeptide repeat-containing protein n=1 Tax=Anisodus acutangulus TaxID=402998 RepID=A0A9Q1M5B8_9SOLA|nr:hypothetical protein K7X08_033303 [Anisodus acutangulus]